MSDGGGNTILIAGGTVKAVLNFARAHHVELGIDHAHQVIPVTDEAQLRGHRGQRLIVLEDCFYTAPRHIEIFMTAREGGMDIVRRRCDEERR